MVGDLARRVIMPFRMRNPFSLIQTAFLLGMVGYLTSAHISFLNASVSRDAGAFMTMAAEIHRGSLPYVDYVDHKPPGIYYFLAAVFLVSETALAAKVSILMVNFATAAMLYFLGRRVWSAVEGLLGAALYLAALPLYGGFYVLTEQLVALTSVGALLLFLQYRETRGYRWLLAAGLAAGFAPLFKQPGFVTPAVLFGVLVVDEFSRSRSGGLRRVVGFSLCAAAPIAATALFFILQGAGWEFIFWTFTVNIEYGGLFTMEENIDRHVEAIGDYRAIWYLGVVGVALAISQAVRIRRLHIPLITALLLLASAVPLLLGPYPHYLIQPLPFASIAAVYVIVKSADVLEQVLATGYAKSVLIAGLLLLSYPVAGALADTESQATEFGLDEHEDLAAVVGNETGDGESLVITAEPAMYFMMGTRPYDENLYYLPANRNVSFTEPEIVNQLESDPPAYILTRQCSRVETICGYVKSEYEPIAEYDQGFSLYRVR